MRVGIRLRSLRLNRHFLLGLFLASGGCSGPLANLATTSPNDSNEVERRSTTTPASAGSSEQPETQTSNELEQPSRPATSVTSASPASLVEAILSASAGESAPSTAERQLVERFVDWDGNGSWEGDEFTPRIRGAVENVAEAGEVEIQFRLAKLLLDNEDQADDSQAAALLKQAAQKGHLPSIHSYAWCLLDGDGLAADPRAGMKLLRQNADQGFARSQNSLGYCLVNGEHVEADQVEAVRWLRASAEQGNASAINSLGHCLANGIGTDQDLVEAFKWFQRGAEAGDSTSKLNLAVCLESGLGVEQDIPRAVALYQETALEDNADAWFALGVHLYNGTNMAQDRVRGKALVAKAASAGHENSKLAMKEISAIEAAQVSLEADLTRYQMELEAERRYWEDYYSEANMMRRAYEAAAYGGY